MARNSKSPDSEDNGLGLKQEVVGILVLAVALYIGVSLFSDSTGANWGGFIGGHLASVLSSVIGYTSYVFPFLLAAVAFKCLLRRVVRISGTVPLGLAVFIPSFSAILSALVDAPGAGGVIGEMLISILTKYLGYTGAFIILFAIVLASVLLVTGTSLIQGGVRLASVVAAIFKALFSMGAKLRRPKKRGVEAASPARAARPGPAGPDRDKGEDKDRVPAIIAPETHAPAPPGARGSATPPGQHPVEEKKEAAASDGHSVPGRGDNGDDEHLEFAGPKGSFKIPPLTLLDTVPETHNAIDKQTLLDNSKTLENKLLDFGVEGRVLEVRPGPVVTMYEFEPAPGVKVGRITSLSDDLALAMKAMSIRIIAPIPGKSVVGIEIPNHERGEILLREILECQAYSKARSRLSLALGKDIAGNPYIADLAKMPHLLVAGATGTGKSVSVNAMIQSILFKATPEEVRFLLVDPKMLELSAYEGIPHLITPVITNPKRAAVALKSIVVEMGRRYRLMAMKGTKNIERYNRLVDGDGEGVGEGAGDGADPGDVEHQRLPYIVVVIDELADLMMTSGKDVEECLVRLSQMARAAGIHLIVATQRPSVDVVTGLIKTNFPARIAFQLPSRIDSRTILDTAGAETLLGEGDMLFLPPSTAKLKRVHGVFVSEKEIKKVADFWKAQGGPAYDKVITEETASAGHDDGEDLGEEFLRRYDEAVELASRLEMISTSYLQRRFRIGYNTAARLIERMEKEGIVGPSQGSRPREVLKRKEV